MRYIDKIIIHCTATKKGLDFSVDDVRRWHLEKGFKDIGYHYLISLKGVVQIGRNIDIVGSHTKGYNENSIGICYVGGLDENLNAQDTRTDSQKDAIKLLVKDLQNRYNITNNNIFGHNDFNKNKECPCFDVKKEFNI